MSDLMSDLRVAQDAMTIGDVPDGIWELVAQAMDIVDDDLGPSLTPDQAAHVMMICSNDLVASIRFFATQLRPAANCNSSPLL